MYNKIINIIMKKKLLFKVLSDPIVPQNSESVYELKLGFRRLMRRTRKLRTIYEHLN